MRVLADSDGHRSGYGRDDHPPAGRSCHDSTIPANPPLAPAAGQSPDDDANRDDERDDENEAPIREVDERTEAPEEFELDDDEEDDQWSELDDAAEPPVDEDDPRLG